MRLMCYFWGNLGGTAQNSQKMCHFQMGQTQDSHSVVLPTGKHPQTPMKGVCVYLNNVTGSKLTSVLCLHSQWRHWCYQRLSGSHQTVAKEWWWRQVMAFGAFSLKWHVSLYSYRIGQEKSNDRRTLSFYFMDHQVCLPTWGQLLHCPWN